MVRIAVAPQFSQVYRISTSLLANKRCFGSPGIIGRLQPGHITTGKLLRLSSTIASTAGFRPWLDRSGERHSCANNGTVFPSFQRWDITASQVELS
jgi:hypothetical protein